MGVELGRVIPFFQIADHLGQAQPWNSYAAAAEAAYRNYYAIPNNYGLPGYWRFPDGIYYLYGLPPHRGHYLARGHPADPIV